MRTFISGMILGGSVVAAGLVGYAYGSDREPQAAGPDSVDVRPIEAGNCDVQVGFGRLTRGDECRFDQVMVGSRSGYILCSDLQVSCPNQ